jgi:NAD(P)-dependent dehydrogenase (short-subunit alcohol dehydrogenase family)
MNENTPPYVIFGAAGGIGSALCHQLAARGARLMLVGRDRERLERLQDSLPPGAHRIFTADATVSTEVENTFAEAQLAYGPIAGAVNLVGSILLKSAHTTTDAEFEQTLGLNTRSAFYILRSAAKAMLNTGGSIVLMSSVAANFGLMNHEAIAAAKGAINGLVISAAATYAPRNIRVNAIAPGLVRTPLAARITGNEAALKASTAMHPLGRIGEPDDVATPIAWLLDPKTTWVTGQVIGIDGGLGAVKAK